MSFFVFLHMIDGNYHLLLKNRRETRYSFLCASVQNIYQFIFMLQPDIFASPIPLYYHLKGFAEKKAYSTYFKKT